MIEFGLQTAYGLVKMLLLVLSIIMPLLILLEVFREFGLIAKVASYLNPCTRLIGIKDNSVFPLLAGIIFGISYGAGVLISESKSGRISRQQAFLIAIFLAVCHAIIEDTLLFVAFGAIGWIAVTVRFSLAIIITAIAAIILKKVAYE